MRITYSIRPAEQKDVGDILNFITELAEFEKAKHEVKVTEQTLQQSLFGDNSNITAVMCEWNGQLVGFAVFFYNYSTWLGKRGLYLEDLYITPSQRGKGAGSFMLQYLANHAVNENCGRFEWNVLDWNTPAIEFYQSLGAKPLTEWVGYRLEGEALTALAKQYPK